MMVEEGPYNRKSLVHIPMRTSWGEESQNKWKLELLLENVDRKTGDQISQSCSNLHAIFSVLVYVQVGTAMSEWSYFGTECHSLFPTPSAGYSCFIFHKGPILRCIPELSWITVVKVCSPLQLCFPTGMD